VVTTPLTPVFDRLSMAKVDGIADTRLGRALDASPELLRDALATAYSLGIRHQRFGREFRRFYGVLARSQSFDEAQVRRAQALRLGWYLRHAIRSTRYYAELVEELGIRDAVWELTAAAVEGGPAALAAAERGAGAGTGGQGTRGSGARRAAAGAGRAAAGAWDDVMAALRLFPPLDKETVRARGADLMCTVAAGHHPIKGHTSGTTGKALELAIGRAGLQRSYACQWHHYSWFGLGLGARVAALAGQTVTAPDRTRPPFWVTDVLGRERLFSSYHLAPGFAPAYAKALREFRPDVVRGLPSSMMCVASFALEQGLRLPRPTVLVSTSEHLFPRQKAVIEEAFGAPVVDFYGCNERAVHAFECPEGRLHVLPQAGVVEVLRDDGTPAAPGEEGEVVCTGYVDDYMPFLRYRLGDRGVLERELGSDGADERRGGAADVRRNESERADTRRGAGERSSARSGGCPCGRQGTIIGELTGRSDDVIVTPDGRRIGRLDQPFKDTLGIREAQIVQERPDALVVKVVPRSGYDEQERETLRRELRLRLGPAMEIGFETVDEIPRGPNGKFQVIRVDPALRPGGDAGDGDETHAGQERDAADACMSGDREQRRERRGGGASGPVVLKRPREHA